jgi:hypothetical protein
VVPGLAPPSPDFADVDAVKVPENVLESNPDEIFIKLLPFVIEARAQ